MNPILTLQRTTREKGTDALFRIITIWNGNGNDRITTNAYKIRDHPDDSKIMKTLLVRFSEDSNTDFSFILYELSQMKTNETYRRQFVLHNNFLTNMAVVLIHGISKEGMKEKTEEKLHNIPGIRSIEETYLAKRYGKWLLLTSKRQRIS